MRSVEEYVAPRSDYYIHMPSRQARETFLYPLQCGHFVYLPGYSLTRESFDSFLLMYVHSGALALTFEGRTRPVTAGSFVLLDCYKLHAYSTDAGWESTWCHFDGPSARGYYEAVAAHLGNVFTLADGYPALWTLDRMLSVFRRGGPVREPLMAKYLTDLLTHFLVSAPAAPGDAGCGRMAEEITAYITEHFAEPLTVEDLAARANMSLYHFIRVFKRETGFTPHEYLLNTRIAAARYLLKNTRLPVKSVCYYTGFSAESVFCGAFKRAAGMTPAQYRALENGPATG